MYVPDRQKLAAASLAFASLRTAGNVVSEGKLLDYAVEKCLDADGNIRCSEPFKVTAGECYLFAWRTSGWISHTTAEIRDLASGEIVYYRDTDGEWWPAVSELVYLDFKPKIWSTGNDTVEYKVTTCEDGSVDL